MDNLRKRGVVFSLEALLGLLVFSSACFFLWQSSLENESATGLSEVYYSQVAQDFLEVLVRNHAQELEGFSQGDLVAASILNEEIAKLKNGLQLAGCMKLETAWAEEILVDCNYDFEGGQVFAGRRLLFDGSNFFEVSLYFYPQQGLLH